MNAEVPNVWSAANSNAQLHETISRLKTIACHCAYADDCVFVYAFLVHYRVFAFTFRSIIRFRWIRFYSLPLFSHWIVHYYISSLYRSVSVCRLCLCACVCARMFLLLKWTGSMLLLKWKHRHRITANFGAATKWRRKKSSSAKTMRIAERCFVCVCV